MRQENSIRNIAIIAHVDHGKTTLVDSMFRQSGIFRDNQQVSERIMDSMDLEREKGITIAAKNCSVEWNGLKINIIDTPGHADFGGEVERALSMADGAVLLVDSSEGPLPQTRFVLKKTLEAGLNVIVVINKIDRKDARPDEVLNEVYDLFIDLGASDDQIDFPVLYAIGRDGVAMKEIDDDRISLQPLFETIATVVPPPKTDREAPFRMLVSDLGYSDYLGRLAIGKIHSGKVKSNEGLVFINESGSSINAKASSIQAYAGLSLVPVDMAEAGDIIVISGIEGIKIGDTIASKDSNAEPLPRITIDEPTVSMKFTINDSPLVGQEGKWVQSSKIIERLRKETLRNVAIAVDETDEKDTFIVKGRGEFQMAILIETMRREGFELCVGRPEVIIKYEEGQKMEPIEHLYVDCAEEFMGVVTEKLSIRKGRMMNMVNNGKGRVRMEFSVPSRSIIGYRDEFLTDTKGTGIMNSILSGYEPYRGDFPSRFTGSIVCDRQGKAIAYALFHLEPRGQLFVEPGENVYEGMIIGEHNRPQDLDVNACKEKKLSNVRASGKDDNILLSPVKPMTLEKAINFIRDDEMVEVTPKSVRLRKAALSLHTRKNFKPNK